MWVDVHLLAHVGIHLFFILNTSINVFQKVCIGWLSQVAFTVCNGIKTEDWLHLEVHLSLFATTTSSIACF